MELITLDCSVGVFFGMPFQPMTKDTFVDKGSRTGYSRSSNELVVSYHSILKTERHMAIPSSVTDLNFAPYTVLTQQAEHFRG